MGCVDAGLALQRLGKTPLGVDQAVFAQPAPSVFGVLFHISLRTAQPEGVTPAVHIGPDACTRYAQSFA